MRFSKLGEFLFKKEALIRDIFVMVKDFSENHFLIDPIDRIKKGMCNLRASDKSNSVYSLNRCEDDNS